MHRPRSSAMFSASGISTTIPVLLPAPASAAMEMITFAPQGEHKPMSCIYQASIKRCSLLQMTETSLGPLSNLVQSFFHCKDTMPRHWSFPKTVGDKSGSSTQYSASHKAQSCTYRECRAQNRVARKEEEKPCLHLQKI